MWVSSVDGRSNFSNFENIIKISIFIEIFGKIIQIHMQIIVDSVVLEISKEVKMGELGLF